MSREFSNRPDEHLGLIFKADPSNSQLAIFIHGFLGNYLTTWGKLPKFLREKSDTHTILKAWDFLFLGYSTRHVETYLDISNIIQTQCNSAFEGLDPYRSKYLRISLLGHSLGTLGIRQFLCNISPDTAGKLKSVTLFGSPLDGSWLAIRNPFIKILAALTPQNPQMRMLKGWTTFSYAKQPWPKPEVIVGSKDRIVGNKAAQFVDWAGDNEEKIHSPFGHTALVKPTSWDNSSVIGYISKALK